MAMRAGALRKRLTIQMPTRTSDALGGYTDTWTAIAPAPMWGALDPLDPRQAERLVGGTIEAKVTHLVTVRYVPGVSTLGRVLYGSRVLMIRGLQNPEERNRELNLFCEEIVSA